MRASSSSLRWYQIHDSPCTLRHNAGEIPVSSYVLNTCTRNTLHPHFGVTLALPDPWPLNRDTGYFFFRLAPLPFEPPRGAFPGRFSPSSVDFGGVLRLAPRVACCAPSRAEGG